MNLNQQDPFHTIDDAWLDKSIIDLSSYTSKPLKKPPSLFKRIRSRPLQTVVALFAAYVGFTGFIFLAIVLEI